MYLELAIQRCGLRHPFCVQIAEQTPLNGLRIGQLALEAGIPPGVLNVIPGTVAFVLARQSDSACFE